VQRRQRLPGSLQGAYGVPWLVGWRLDCQTPGRAGKLRLSDCCWARWGGRRSCTQAGVPGSSQKTAQVWSPLQNQSWVPNQKCRLFRHLSIVCHSDNVPCDLTVAEHSCRCTTHLPLLCSHHGDDALLIWSILQNRRWQMNALKNGKMK